ncbi:MAG: sigma-70 family RNA polymerase sigma factor [Balneolaceae bacterium]
MPKDDYSELVTALEQGDEKRANELLKEVIWRLKDYLTVVLGAPESEAEECAHQAFLAVFERIRDGKIRDPKTIFSYFLTSARNEYFRVSRGMQRFDHLEEPYSNLIEPAQQVERLLDEERQRILEECLQELDGEAREFITWYLAHPDADTQVAATRFGISHANSRTRKSRITSRLHDCVKRKSSS